MRPKEIFQFGNIADIIGIGRTHSDGLCKDKKEILCVQQVRNNSV